MPLSVAVMALAFLFMFFTAAGMISVAILLGTRGSRVSAGPWLWVSIGLGIFAIALAGAGL